MSTKPQSTSSEVQSDPTQTQPAAEKSELSDEQLAAIAGGEQIVAYEARYSPKLEIIAPVEEYRHKRIL